MEAAKAQSGPCRFNQSLGRRDSATQDRIMAVAAMAQTISGKDRRRRKALGTPLCVRGSVLRWEVFPARHRRTMQAVKRV